MTSVLQLDGVTRRYGGVCAVDDVSIEVAEGELLCIIGPNIELVPPMRTMKTM